MGIHGVFKEIGPGERIALSKLAVQKFEETGRPLRIAIDISIWLFQIQSSKGGTNPALRTFYYRLLRLISLAIHPLFVFDGPNKPAFKRNKRTGPNVASIPEYLAKQLLKKFGLPFHKAPGEAEAECALLQREGIVDAVLSEDVDTLMFGSGILFRNWSSEAGSSKKVPTHINVYDKAKIKAGKSGLDSQGMILVALMSGGDYLPGGIPGCGPKIACQAARANFGHELCSIKRNDRQALAVWRERLQYELRTNESKFFERRHTKLEIPENFPDREVLGYYTHPAVSSKAQLAQLKDSISWDQDIDIPDLRTFTAEAFDWRCIGGAKKFIRNLAPALLIRELRLRGVSDERDQDDLETIQLAEARLVKDIYGRRNHPDTDNVSELRVGFLPIELVPIDLSAEPPDEVVDGARDDGSGSEDEVPLPSRVEEAPESTQNSLRKRAPSTYDPTKVDKIWVLETYLKVGVPLKVEDWEETLRNPTKYAVAKAASRKAAKGTKSKKSSGANSMPKGALHQYTRVVKPIARPSDETVKPKDDSNASPHEPTPTSPVRASGQSRSPSGPSFKVPEIPISTPQRNRQQTLFELLSPSPRRSQLTTHAPPCPPTVSSVVPSTVTKRRRRSPIKRTNTLPETQSDFMSAVDRPATPSSPGLMQALDLSPTRIGLSAPGNTFKRVKPTKSRNAQTPPIDQEPISLLFSPGALTPARAHSQTRQNRPSSREVIEQVDLSRSPLHVRNNEREDCGSRSKDPPQQSIERYAKSADAAKLHASTHTELRNQTRAGNDDETRLKAAKKATKRFVIPRESLPGTWKIDEVEVHDLTGVLGPTDGNSRDKTCQEDKKGKGRKGWRLSQVETIDLTMM